VLRDSVSEPGDGGELSQRPVLHSGDSLVQLLTCVLKERLCPPHQVTWLQDLYLFLLLLGLEEHASGCLWHVCWQGYFGFLRLCFRGWYLGLWFCLCLWLRDLGCGCLLCGVGNGRRLVGVFWLERTGLPLDWANLRLDCARLRLDWARLRGCLEVEYWFTRDLLLRGLLILPLGILI
jgi:hypothetical protein